MPLRGWSIIWPFFPLPSHSSLPLLGSEPRGVTTPEKKIKIVFKPVEFYVEFLYCYTTERKPADAIMKTTLTYDL